MPVSYLANKWNPRSAVVYIGKAGPSSKRTLKKRLNEYLCFGAGDAIAHWGGRLTWQLSNPEDLEVSWKTESHARALETELLAVHLAEFGTMPFANLRR